MVKERNLTSVELLIYLGSDSSHEAGTLASLAVYTSKSNVPINDKIYNIYNRLEQLVRFIAWINIEGKLSIAYIYGMGH